MRAACLNESRCFDAHGDGARCFTEKLDAKFLHLSAESWHELQEAVLILVQYGSA